MCRKVSGGGRRGAVRGMAGHVCLAVTVTGVVLAMAVDSRGAVAGSIRK